MFRLRFVALNMTGAFAHADGGLTGGFFVEGCGWNQGGEGIAVQGHGAIFKQA